MRRLDDAAPDALSGPARAGAPRGRGIGSRTAGGLIGAALFLCTVSPADGAAPGTTASEPAPLRRVEVPGTLLDSAIVSRDGVRTLALLVRDDAPGEGGEGREPRSGSESTDDEEPTRDLYLLDPAADRLELLASGLPEPAGRLIPLGDEPGGPDLGLLAERFGHLDLLLPAPGRAGQSTGKGGAALATFDLPRRAERTSRGLRLTSPAAHPLQTSGSGADGGAPCFATEPEARGRRLRVVVLCPGAAEPEELWMLLPAAETVTSARFLDLDGSRVLAVLTRDKLGVFVKQDLRIFPLAPGRARLGSDPLLAVPTGCPLWRDHELTAADADGDGREDVVLLCRRGLIDQELRVEVYPSRPSPPSRGEDDGGLGFERRGRTMHLEGDYDSWRYGADLTGDGLPDLVAQRDGWTLELHAGKGRGGPVEARPAWTLPVPREPSEEDEDGDRRAGRNRPQDRDPDEARVEVSVGTAGGQVRILPGGARMLEVLDLDGDGHLEILLYQRLREDPVADRAGPGESEGSRQARRGETVYRGGRLTILAAP